MWALHQINLSSACTAKPWQSSGCGRTRSRISFLTEIFLDPSSWYSPCPSGKLTHHCAFLVLHSSQAVGLLAPWLISPS